MMGPGSSMLDQKDASYFQYAAVPVNPSPAISPYNHAPLSGTASITTFSPGSSRCAEERIASIWS
jgi:hypothetical protein